MRLTLVLAIGVLSVAALPAPGQDGTAKRPAHIEEANGMPPRSAPTDYQAQGKAGDVTFGAEFLGDAVPRDEQNPLSTDDYVVVEAGLFGAPGQKLNLSPDQFTLRINGKKNQLESEPYGLVISSLRDPLWVSPEEAAKKKEKAEGGGGGSGLSMNGQGGNNDSTPLIVHIPVAMQRSMGETVRMESLPEGNRELPVSGLLFFPYRGKRKGIRSIELTYNGPAGKVTIPLQP